ncbi:MAG: hypothetical protein KAT15_10085, partial [Bacteroidales bacterium]|nr:hypothetical protein [Bacteroidales bacterium]
MIKSRHRRVAIRCLLVLGILQSACLLSGQKVTRLEIMNAELTAFDVQIGRDARKLVGDVRVKHEDVIMFCDSAYIFMSSNSVDAFSNVKIVQGDTLTLTGNRLHYDGNSKILRVRNNVKLVNKEMTLVTDSLDYHRAEKFATYMGGGILTQENSRLTSERGRFFTESEIFYFMDSVVLTNPEYNIYTDSLKYDTQTEISYFSGPTEIISEERYIYCENGWYDTQQDISFVTDNAFLEEEGRMLKGDTLYYDAQEGFGRAHSNVELIDTADNMTLKGN